jgi:hypothetical protein
MTDGQVDAPLTAAERSAWADKWVDAHPSSA